MDSALRPAEQDTPLIAVLTSDTIRPYEMTMPVAQTQLWPARPSIIRMSTQERVGIYRRAYAPSKYTNYEHESD